MGPVVFLDSLLMAHPRQHAEALFGFGVDLNMILERSTTCVQRVRLYSWILCWYGASMAACWKLWLWCEPQHDLGTINHTRTMGPVVFLDSLLMAHPWQHAEGLFSLGVDLNTILEWSNTQPNQKSSHIQIQHIEGVWEASYVVNGHMDPSSLRCHCRIRLWKSSAQFLWSQPTYIWYHYTVTVSLGALILLMVMIKDLC